MDSPWVSSSFPPFFHRANRRCSRFRRRRLPRQQLPQLCGGGLRRSEALLDGLQEMRQDVHLGDLISTVDGTVMAILWYFDVVSGDWWMVPSGYVKIAIENGHRNSGFTH